MTKGDGERIAALEVQVQHLTDTVVKLTTKIDELIVFRARGVGAFWLASALLGTGIVGSVVTLVEWIKSWH